MIESLIKFFLEIIRGLSDMELTVVLLLMVFIPLTLGLFYGGRKK